MSIIISAAASYAPITLIASSKSLAKSFGRSIEREVLQQLHQHHDANHNKNKNSCPPLSDRDFRRQEFLLKSFFSAKFASSQPFFTYIELFAGVGGFGLACEKLGGRCVFASEIIIHAKKCWQRNFGNGDTKFINETKQKAFGAKWNTMGDVTNFMEEQKSDVHNSLKVGDIRKVPDSDIPKHADVLCGGFPCQPFTRAGDQPATACDDGNLYLQVIRVLKIAKPKILFLENVPGMHTAENGEVLGKIGDSLREVGYDVITGVMDSSCLVPQIRRRMYFIGFRRESVEKDDGLSSSQPPPSRRDRIADNNDHLHFINKNNQCLSRFQWPKLFKLNRTFSEIVQHDPIVLKAFTMVESRWKKHLEICSDISKWLIKMDKPGPTLVRSYRRGPGVGAGKKFLEAVEKKETENNNTNNNNINDDDNNDNTDGSTIVNNNGNNNRTGSGWHNLVPLPLSVDFEDDKEQQPQKDEDDQTNSSKKNKQIPVRWISSREGARMQGFPEEFWIPEENEAQGPGTALFGNAVTVPVVTALLHSALCATKGGVSFYQRRRSRYFQQPQQQHEEENDDRIQVVSEMLLDSVPEENGVRENLQKQIEENKSKLEDVVLYSRVI